METFGRIWGELCEGIAMATSQCRGATDSHDLTSRSLLNISDGVTNFSNLLPLVAHFRFSTAGVRAEQEPRRQC
jgi:hypothetical protein